MKLSLLLTSALLLSACGSGGGSSPPTPSLNIREYLAQSVSLDGNSATLLHDTSPLTHQRFDIGRYQRMTSFLVSDGAITSWSYAPFGAFSQSNEAGCPPPGAPCRGDGGEKIILSGTRAQIVSTQDGGIAGVQPFSPPWTIIDAAAPPCSLGWLRSGLDRICRTTTTLPSAGLGHTSITAAAFVSEHGEPASSLERRIQARGWGLLWWAAFDKIRPPVDPARCPDFGYNSAPGLTLTDCRLSTQLEPADGSLLAGQLWHP